jgi:hypothetical protein
MKGLDGQIDYLKNNMDEIHFKYIYAQYVARLVDIYKDMFGLKRIGMIRSFIKFTTPKEKLRLFRTFIV